MTGLPSPTPSLTPNDNDPNQTQSKKRLRSASMQSATSSTSPKRSQSQGPIVDPPPSELEPPAQDFQAADITMDSPMATPVEGTVGDAQPAPVSDVSTEHATMWQDVPTEQKVRIGTASMQDAMQVGETWYLVSARWYKRWHKAVTMTEDKEGPIDEKDVGPVDNSDLVDGDGNLVDTLVEGENVKFVPEQLWVTFQTWYGKSQHPLPRKVRAIGERQEASLELRPPQFTPLRLVSNADPAITGPPPPTITLSADTPVVEFCQKLAQAVRLPHEASDYRVWALVHPRTEVDGSQYPISRLLEVGAKLLSDGEEQRKSLDDALIQSGDLFAVEFKTGTGWLVDTAAVPAPGDAPGTSNELPPPLFNSENDFFSRLQTSAGGKPSSTSTINKDVAIRSSSSKFPAYFGKTAASSKAISIGSSKAKDPGTLGLGNMGNTCFMNSALQCLSHTKELADYFLTGVYHDELNPDNPLGMGGAIAQTFGKLMQKIWSTDAGASSYSPREFKQALQRFAPQFSGYQQHDSQELVAFLLDGLHEDLNRIIKKPYVEKPDWEGGAEKEMVELAKKSWDGYLMRNDSVIVDLFQGQYRSTLVCPECQKVSITFDPFMYLTLPLPVTKKWKHTIFFVPWDPSKPHVKVPVEITLDASCKDLRQLLGRWMDVHPDNLVTMEVFQERFYKSLDDHVMCTDISSNDLVVCYELPSHGQQNRSYKKQEDDPFVLPVMLTRDTSGRTTSYLRDTGKFGYPFLISLTQAEAKDERLIYEALIDRLQRWTVNARDLYSWQVGSGDTVMDEVPIPLAPSESLTEIQENGDVVTIQPTVPDEDDIADQKSVLVEDDNAMGDAEEEHPRKVGVKANVFSINILANYTKSIGTYNANNFKIASWESRHEDDDPVLLRRGDALQCVFDENMQDYFFGNERSRFEHARWDTWEEFIHPELAEARKTLGEKRQKGITLQNCLDEFVKEEQLGEDDLWYCPRCKKHQQATKKFDLWKAPDVLVVHLKRFSNSRALRDKIDTFVDFPVEDLDLEPMIHERKVAKILQDQGVDIGELGLEHQTEPLIYDLFAVDEHLGGLGGGHYRAYALNHVTEKWYHFDDSYVTQSRASEAVNANAYLLFYRRRTSHPLGGKSTEKVEEARKRAPPADEPEQLDTAMTDTQLPTPPDETPFSRRMVEMRTSRSRKLSDELDEDPLVALRGFSQRSPMRAQSSLGSGSPPTLDDDGGLDSLADGSLNLASSDRFDFPDPSSHTSVSVSPNTSSVDIPLTSTRATIGEWSARTSNFGQADPDDTDHLTLDALPDQTRSLHAVDPNVHPQPPVKVIPIEETTLYDIE